MKRKEVNKKFKEGEALIVRYKSKNYVGYCFSPGTSSHVFVEFLGKVTPVLIANVNHLK